MTLHHGDCLEVLRTMPDNSVDSIVTDPPYGLSFMGKKWDYDVPSEDIWRECLRVLKPGGHLLAFAGTRTQHRMACRIEDAGFEIRDMIAWVYGSGFPKSLDVGKAIDNMDAAEAQQARRYRFTEWVRSQGVASKQIDDATGTNMGGHYTTAASQPAIMTREHLEACRPLFRDVPEWVEREADIRSVESKNFAEREVVEERKATDRRGDGTVVGLGHSGNADITAPATDAARQWSGWGTALKPALEPITVARKPLIGTVAANVLAHGSGGINVDGCRVGTDESLERVSGGADGSVGDWGMKRGHTTPQPEGRWPANVLHDGSEEVLGLFPVTGASKANARNTKRQGVAYGTYSGTDNIVGHDDNGSSAARFFYCAKANKKDRDEGCEGLEAKVHGCGEKRANHHPTVKPTDLMRYLCRLVTPPNGIVLDPFMGSGSTGKAALLEGFQFIGIERDAEYLEIAKARIQHPNQSELFQP